MEKLQKILRSSLRIPKGIIPFGRGFKGDRVPLAWLHLK